MSVTPESYHRVFVGHNEGQSVLDDMLARFDSAVSFVPGGLDAQRMSDLREGQRSVVRWIAEVLARVESGERDKFPKIIGR